MPRESSWSLGLACSLSDMCEADQDQEHGSATEGKESETTVSLPSPSRGELEQFRHDLDASIKAHGAWVRSFYRGLVFRIGPASTLDSCSFGGDHWKDGSRSLRRYTGVEEIEQCHRASHEAAETISDILHRVDALIGAQDLEVFQLAEARLADAARQWFLHLAVTEYMFDPVTNVSSRHALSRVLQREHNRMVRSGHACSIALADLDEFKTLNDKYGHPMGDLILRESARSFSNGLRPYDSVFRYGGDEFLFCLPNASASKARRIVERLRSRLEEQRLPVGTTDLIRLTASFGIAELRENRSIQDSIGSADKALYDAKRLGRNRVRVQK